MQEDEKQLRAQAGQNRASSTIERLALSVSRVEGWQAVSGASSIWDVPMVTATHLLVANAEMDGAHHIPFDLIQEALKNGTRTT